MRPLFDASWPTFDEALAREDLIQLVVQVNGKVRDRMDVAADIARDEALAMALDRDAIQRHLNGQEPRKVIFVPGRLLNLVA